MIKTSLDPMDRAADCISEKPGKPAATRERSSIMNRPRRNFDNEGTLGELNFPFNVLNFNVPAIERSVRLQSTNSVTLLAKNLRRICRKITDVHRTCVETLETNIVANVYRVVFNNARSITSHGDVCKYVQVINSANFVPRGIPREGFERFSRVLHDERRLARVSHGRKVAARSAPRSNGGRSAIVDKTCL